MFFDIANVGSHFVVVVVTMVVPVVMTFYWLIQIFFSLLPGSGKMVGKSGSQSRFLRIGRGGFGGRGGGDVSAVRFSLEAWSASWTNLRKSAGGNGGEGEKETRKKKDRSYFFLSFYSFLTKKYCKKNILPTRLVKCKVSSKEGGSFNLFVIFEDLGQ